MAPDLKSLSPRWVNLATAGVVALAVLYGVTLDFLLAEDAAVLFNRANNLDGGLLFHYGGYVSVVPQLVAAAVAGLPPMVQVLAYAAVAVAVMGLMLRAVVRASGHAEAGLLVALYFLGFSTLFFYNLIYALWPAALLLMLLGHVATLERRQLTWGEVGLAGVLASFSPLALFALPVFLHRVVIDRADRRNWIVVAFAVLSFLVLPDRLSEGSRVGGAAEGLIRHLAFCLDSPAACLGVRRGLMPLTPAQLASYASVLVVVGAILLLLPSLRPGEAHRPRRSLLMFLLGPAGILAASLATVPPPLGVRHLFPCIVGAAVAAAVLLGPLAARVLRPAALALGLVALAALGFKTVADFGARRVALAELLAPGGEDVILYRNLNGKVWSVMLSERRYALADCTRLPDIITEHEAYEAAVSDTAALIYCDARRGTVLVPGETYRVVGR